jgi:hypothetical protein
MHTCARYKNPVASRLRFGDRGCFGDWNPGFGTFHVEQWLGMRGSGAVSRAFNTTERVTFFVTANSNDSNRLPLFVTSPCKLCMVSLALLLYSAIAHERCRTAPLLQVLDFIKQFGLAQSSHNGRPPPETRSNPSRAVNPIDPS